MATWNINKIKDWGLRTTQWQEIQTYILMTCVQKMISLSWVAMAYGKQKLINKWSISYTKNSGLKRIWSKLYEIYWRTLFPLITRQQVSYNSILVITALSYRWSWLWQHDLCLDTVQEMRSALQNQDSAYFGETLSQARNT